MARNGAAESKKQRSNTFIFFFSQVVTPSHAFTGDMSLTYSQLCLLTHTNLLFLRALRVSQKLDNREET